MTFNLIKFFKPKPTPARKHLVMETVYSSKPKSPQDAEIKVQIKPKGP